MFELPRYVHRVTKQGKGTETVYTFYTRHRNTPQAWPSLNLPDPLDDTFLLRVRACEAMERDEKGFLIAGKRLPGHRDATFWDAAEKAIKAVIRRRHEDVKDFTALIDGFAESERWTALSASTQRGYRAYGKMVKEAWGYDLPASLTTIDAQEAIDVLGDRPATANQFRAYLSRLMAWGIPRGFCTFNPVASTEKIPGGEPWKPWPDWAFETMIEHAPFNMLLPAVSAFFTGQRQGDVLKMVRPRGNLIEVRAQKTKTTVWIPIHSEYQRWIDKADDADAIQLHIGARGLPYKTADGFRTEWSKMMKKAEFARFPKERIVFHGLRKNAVINLLEVGCTEAEVGAIVNMSEQMVRHYGRDVSLRQLARNGMKRLEDNWGDVRSRFGQ